MLLLTTFFFTRIDLGRKQLSHLGLELVQHNVLVLLANIDLKFSNPGIERSQDLALAGDVLADLGFRVISHAQ